MAYLVASTPARKWISGLIDKVNFSLLVETCSILSHLQMTFAMRLGIHSQAG
jgi:hypothetical protein